MTDLVLDSSAAVYALTVRSAEASSLRQRLRIGTCHAPHLVGAEVGNVLRRLELAHTITSAQALTALRALPHLIDEHYPHDGPLGERAWQLRGAITFYDALYVALADGLGAPLVTADERLSRAPGLPCVVDVVG